MTPWSLLRNVLLAVSLVTLAEMIPLNSLVLSHPDEWLCLSCLLTVYAVSIAVLTLWLSLLQLLRDGKLYAFSLYACTVVALVFFFVTIQVAAIPRPWVAPYVIACGLGLVLLTYSFARKGPHVIHELLLFALVLSLYESVNIGRIVSRELAWSALDVPALEAPSKKRVLADAPHVFIVIFDELALVHVLKGDALDNDLVPNLAEFARSAGWFRQAVTPYAFTEYAIPALLTGREGLGTFSEVFLKQQTTEHLFSLATPTHEVYISGFYLPYCPAFRSYVRGCRSLSTGFSGYGALFRSWWDRAIPGEARFFGFGRRLRDILAGGFDPSKTLTEALHLGQNFSVPTFTYIHVGLPHDPFMFRSNGEVRLGEVGLTFRFKSMTQEQLFAVRSLYLEQVAYTDRLFGLFLAQLRALKLYDESLIIVTSDHGISFAKAHPWRHQQWIAVDEISRVPFLVKMPGQDSNWVDDRRVLNSGLYEIVEHVLEPDQAHRRKNLLPRSIGTLPSIPDAQQ
jgi:hypothetical protein